ncbi:MAG TPA: hypothetical protein PLZ93_16440 [Nocardioides sp.]|uniref:hypothetical protein n=1 Tax=uncultured Nocardioides sp. TaxID=198441 RepID=UPI000EEDF910|nr:hypothetical protein [uncultured Nocardioides sp.]HCB02676.1 hypothetical protein [Nocardioides sp.]HRD63579.1 hypothetical protein [Nocardioides sp.]HRI97206.1 hypothetical protein [Nocardioides sp.]HRK46418.1 hypothetical protein [Nocardioides sp.]
MDLIDVTTTVVLPAISRTFKAGEVAELSIDMCGHADPRVAVRVRALGGVFEAVAFAPGIDHATAADWSEQLSRGLEDFLIQRALAED